MLDQNRSSTPKDHCSSNWQPDANTVFTDYIRVMKARARVDSALASLGGGEQAIWDVIADVQKFDALVRRSRPQGPGFSASPNGVSSRRHQRPPAVPRILGFLTTLTLVTLAIALLGYLVGGLSDDQDQYRPLRYGFLALGLVAAAVLWWVTFRMRPRPRKQVERDIRRRNNNPAREGDTEGW